MLVHSLASKYAGFAVIERQRYWTPSDHWTHPLLKSDDLFFREPRDIGPPPFKNPGHAPDEIPVIHAHHVWRSLLKLRWVQAHFPNCFWYMYIYIYGSLPLIYIQTV